MLIGIVEHHDFRALGLRQQAFHPFTTFLVDRHLHLREFALHLQRFVADVRGRALRVGHDKTVCSASVATA